MFDRCRSLLAQALDSVSEKDASAGERLQALDDLVDMDYAHLLGQMKELKQEQLAGSSLESVLLLVLLIRCIERMADHAVNASRRMARLG
jgi:phosphate transport system protein